MRGGNGERKTKAVRQIRAGGSPSTALTFRQASALGEGVLKEHVDSQRGGSPRGNEALVLELEGVGHRGSRSRAGGDGRITTASVSD